LTFTWTEDVRAALVDEAFSTTYGARNLRRTIQKRLEDPISEQIIDSFEKPISSISAQCENSGITITVQ